MKIQIFLEFSEMQPIFNEVKDTIKRAKNQIFFEFFRAGVSSNEVQR